MIPSFTTRYVFPDVDFDLKQELIQQMAAALARKNEELLRDALGRWVSEEEPAACFDEAGKFLGLRPAGWLYGGITVPA